MPPRYAYWTILAGGLPTAFRTTTREELLPTFRRLKEKHSDAEMKWFARGQLWESPAEAEAALTSPRRAKSEGQGAKGQDDRERSVRGKDWRPGGEHRDPHQRFRDAKKARNQQRRQERWARKAGDREQGARGPAAQPGGNWRGKPTGRPGAKAGGKPWVRAEKHRKKPN